MLKLELALLVDVSTGSLLRKPETETTYEHTDLLHTSTFLALL